MNALLVTPRGLARSLVLTAAIACGSLLTPMPAVASSATTLTITTTTLPGAVQIQPYRTTLKATGGTPPYRWGATGLSRGMRLSSSGVLSGAPTLPGSIPFTVTVTDSTGATATQKYLLLIDYPPVLQMITTRLPNPTVGQFYSAPIHATGGEPPYVWAVTDKVLPPGLEIDIPTGTVSGTPTQTGKWRFAITDNDNAGEVAIRYFTLDVKPAPAFTTTTLIALIVGIVLFVLVIGFGIWTFRKRSSAPRST